MRFSAVYQLVHFYFLFLRRRVLGRGVLANRPIRYGAFFGVLALYTGYVLLSISVVRQTFNNPEIIAPILEGMGISSIFWVAAFYTIVRILFLKADELTELTYTLPATNKERLIASVVFEMLLVGTATIALSSALAIACSIVVGWKAAELFLFGVVSPALVTYLILLVIHLGVEQLLALVGMARLRGLVIPALLAGLMAVAFSLMRDQSIEYMRIRLLEDTAPWVPQLAFLRIEEAIGGPLGAAGAVLALLGVCGLLLALAIAIAPKDYTPLRSYFLALPGSLANTRFGALVLMQFRSFENQFVLVSAVVAAFAIPWKSWNAPPAYIMLPAFLGIYAYASSEPLRRLTPFRQSAGVFYLQLIGSQATIMLALGAVLGTVYLAQGGQLSDILTVFGFGLVSIVMTNLVGIIFPPEKGNPFSVVIGVILLLSVVATFALGLNMFGLPTEVNVTIIAVLLGFAVFFSVLGISRNEKGVRHEMVHL